MLAGIDGMRGVRGQVAHRDIKLENIVFSSKHPGSRVVLIDFGLAAILPEVLMAVCLYIYVC